MLALDDKRSYSFTSCYAHGFFAIVLFTGDCLMLHQLIAAKKVCTSTVCATVKYVSPGSAHRCDMHISFRWFSTQENGLL